MKQYAITGMSCAACSARIEKVVSQVPGVESCSVSLLTNSMGVEGDAADEAIISAVENAGYGASAKEEKHLSQPQAVDESLLEDTETPRIRKRLIASVIFLVILMYVSMGHMMLNFPLPTFMEDNHVMMGLIQLVLTVTIMVINQKFFISGFKSLFHRAPNMDTLVALGASASFLYSLWALFAMTDAQLKMDHDAVLHYMHEFYFESAAMILTLITVGKMLEAHSKGKTTNALKSLMKLKPKQAVILKGETEIEIPIEQVKTGDIFVVRPGENIPVDGIVLEGSGAVDEAALTGESIPVDKEPGDPVSAATTNKAGFLKCEATRVGEDTTISQIIRMVSDAAATKAPVAKIADKVSGIFVPVVIIIAIITFLVWMLLKAPVGDALTRAVAVLVISCPCALGLATPVAIMVGNGLGARNGILFKTAISLEETGKAQIAVLDKTGTITKGEPALTDIIPAAPVDANKFLKFAYSLEIKSGHPLAKAVADAAEKEKIEAFETDDFKELPGNGLVALIKGKRLCGGNLKFIQKEADVPDEFAYKADEFAGEGKTPILFAFDGKILGMLAVADVIKDESPAAIEELKAMGIRVVMLTGDNEKTASSVGAKVGIEHIIAGVLPDGKEGVIRELKKKGKVVMTGDGINDAPALTSADMGIAIGAGADVAIDAADVVLVNSSLKDVPAAVRLSRATLKNIHQNLFWAFIYNVIGIPLAAGVFSGLLGWQLNPMIAAAAMSLSSFCVVMNALRLNLFKLNDLSKDRPKKGMPVVMDEKDEDQNSVMDIGEKPCLDDGKNCDINDMEDKRMEKILDIEGMMCKHCEARVKKALEAIDGVKEAKASHEENQAVVTLKAEVDDATLKQAVEEQDYTVTEIRNA